MTIQGAMKELVNLLNADDIPVYYKGGIKKAIETIDDYIDGKDDYVKRMADRKTENSSENPNNCEDEPTWEQVKEYCNKRCLDIVDSALRKKWYKDEPQTDYTPDCPFCKRYGTEDCLGSDCRHYKTYKTEPQTERSNNADHIE